MKQPVRLVLVVLGLITSVFAGCAPKLEPVPPPAAPRYAEYVFPAPVAGARVPAAVAAEHQSAWHLLQGGNVRDAERRFSGLLKRDAAFFPAQAGLGYAALSRKDFKSALESFDRALKADPAYAPAHAGKGQTYVAMGRREDALASFDAALQANPALTAIRNAADVLRVQDLQGGVAEARRAAAEGRLADARAAYGHAIAASPQSPFLYRELADIERKEGALDRALEHARTAVSLDPTEPRAFVVLADVLEAKGQFGEAADALSNAVSLEPSETLSERTDALRARVSFAAMPEEFRSIEKSDAITRAQLAALIGVRLESLVKRAPRTATAVITDTRSNWAQPWILPVTRAGFMEVYPNHAFQPNAQVRRRDLAFAASRILSVIAADRPALAAQWRNPKRRFPDVPTGHLSYPAAAVAVEAGVIRPVENGAFGLARPVSGREAIEAVTRLLELAGPAAR